MHKDSGSYMAQTAPVSTSPQTVMNDDLLPNSTVISSLREEVDLTGDLAHHGLLSLIGLVERSMREIVRLRESVEIVKAENTRLRERMGEKDIDDEHFGGVLQELGEDMRRIDHIASGSSNYISRKAFAKGPAQPSPPMTLPAFQGTSASIHAPHPLSPQPQTPPTRASVHAQPMLLSGGSNPKWPNPTTFDGKKESVKAFLDALTIKYHYQPNTYPSDSTKISNALSLIVINPTIRFWVTAISGQIAERIRDPSLPTTFASYSDFKEKFREYFGLKDEKVDAQVKIHKLYQGTWSAEEYVHQFNEVAKKTKFDEEMLLQTFQVSMDCNLRAQIQRDKVSRRVADTLAGWQAAAIAIDKENRFNREQNAHFDALSRLQSCFTRNSTTAAVPAVTTSRVVPPAGPPPSQYYYPRPPAPANPTAAAALQTQAAPRPAPAFLPPRPPARFDPNTMEVNRSRGRPPVDRANIRCYKCGQKGHIVNYCPNPAVLGFLEIQSLRHADYQEMLEKQKKEEKIAKENAIPAEQVFQ